MIPLTYTHDFDLQQVLTALDTTRRDILTTPVSLHREWSNQWEALLARITGSIYLTGEQVPKQLASDIILHNPKRPTLREWTILSLRDEYETIRYDWNLTDRAVSWKDIAGFAIRINDARLNQPLAISDSEGTSMVTYIAKGNLHPVVQAAIVTSWLLVHPPFHTDRGKTARVVGYLYLSRYGYDVRGLVALERRFAPERGPFDRALQSITDTGTLTRWIHFFAQSLLGEYQSILETVSHNSHVPDSSLHRLTSRQQEILRLVLHPQSILTNKVIQTQFHISQITASRELAKLANIGLLRMHGKGRSVSYTKV